jgi:cytochrome c
MKGWFSMRSSLVVPVMILVCGVAAVAQGPTYKLGRAATEEELRSPDAAIGPDGEGLPPGSGTPAQGAATFAARGCGRCHGPNLTEGPAPNLVGPRRQGASMGHEEGGNWAGRGIVNFPFAPLVFSFIRQAMPLDRSGYLTADEIYGLTAFLLQKNGIIQEDDVMNAKSLPQVRMPGRDAYTPPPFSEWKPGMRRAHATKSQAK